jgi:hypothetical protein
LLGNGTKFFADREKYTNLPILLPFFDHLHEHALGEIAQKLSPDQNKSYQRGSSGKSFFVPLSTIGRVNTQ